MRDRYPDGHNCGPGMVYDTPDEKEIARLNKKLKTALELVGHLNARLNLFEEALRLISMRKEGFEEDNYRCIEIADEALAAAQQEKAND